MNILRRKSFRILFAAVGAFLAAATFFTYFYNQILAHPDPQSPIAILFLIIESGFVVLASFFFIWSVVYIFSYSTFAKSSPDFTKARLSIACIAAVALSLLGTVRCASYFSQQHILAEASSPQTTPSILLELYRGAASPYDHQIMMRLAENSSSSSNLLRDLSKDQNTSVRTRVAGNPNTPLDVLENLSDDEAWVVRSSLPPNRSTPNSILEKLASDKNATVRENARFYLETRKSVKSL